jgi:hypothetical protein
MKIIENTPDRLVLRNYPTLQIVMGLIFALTGMVITFFFGRSVDLHCDKLEPGLVNCRLGDKWMGYLPLGERMAQHVQSAEVDESTDSEGDSTYKVVLVTDAGRVSLTSFYSSGYSAKANLAQRVNGFLQASGQRTLDLKVNTDWWILIFLFLFTGGGVVVILLAKTTGIEMVRSEGVLRILKDGLFGRGQEEHILREIESVVLESSSGSRGSTTYRIAFHVVDGGELLLTRWYSSGRKDKQQAVDAMNAFLAAYRPPLIEG